MFIENVIKGDSFNYYCVDCKANPSTHASLTFGVLICEKCAEEHKKVLGLEKSFIKPLSEFWYDYQLKFISLNVGGNKPFYDFMKSYN